MSGQLTQQGQGSSHNRTRSFWVPALATAFSIGGLWVGYKLSKYVRTQRRRQRLLIQYQKEMIPDSARMEAIKEDFMKQLDYGRENKVTPTGRHMLMLPSYVTALPTGLESGDSYAIDLGGTNFRVLHVVLSKEPSKVECTEMTEVSIPPNVYKGTGQQLFDFLATTLKDFIKEHKSKSSDMRVPVVGFCFSFPMDQTSLTQGLLLDWTKGFTCTGVIGQDPVALLSQALDRAGMHCRVSALLNDTIGVWAAQRYFDPKTSIGLILGTGTNACYVLPVARIPKWDYKDPSLQHPEALTVVNVEWGAFESQWLPRTAEDRDVDASTAHKGKYLFEKLVSGMFLGEVARRILLTLAADTKLFGDYSTSPDAACVLAKLAEPSSFTSVHMSAIVGEAMESKEQQRKGPAARDMLPKTAEMLHKSLGAGPAEAPPSTRKVVKEVCVMVALRSAKMVALGLDALLTHSGWKDWALHELATQERRATDLSLPSLATTIAIDGSVFAKFGGYQAMLASCMLELLGPELHPLVHIKLTQDGSSLGAVVLAQAAAEEAARKSRASADEGPVAKALEPMQTASKAQTQQQNSREPAGAQA
ncbi:hexokinase [Dunaliella salina]|uniref:Phosphotransferase n=1 Tax=Dunaliella salina TaxID=3046 RepID=A0ABQ7G5Y7_DUNSA|nr:hexokinase [Dunaliella salina]|eukprot:KAF5830028.1 hexokinase [Dunaliella salina]